MLVPLSWQKQNMINIPNTNILPAIKHQLHESASVHLGPCGIPEIKKFEAALPGYQLNMVSKEYLNALIYSGPEAEKHIYLYHHDNHYDVITSMPAIRARKQHCHKCKKGYDEITDHPCGDLFMLCHRQSCPIVKWIHCNDCNRYYKSQECYTTTIKMTTAPPNLYVGPLSSARDVIVS